MSSPHGGYYKFLLSEDYQEELGHDNYADDEMKSGGLTNDWHDIRFQNEGWSKNFSEDEYNLHVSARLNVGQDRVDENQQKMQHSREELRLIIISTGHSRRTVIGSH
jgi:hypothetical protein